MEAVQVHAPGGTEVLKVDRLETPVPGPGETLVRVQYAGVNFRDAYQRQARLPGYPIRMGIEGAGVVEAVGPGESPVRVIGTVSSDAKAHVARAAGADDLILYTEQDFVAEVNRLTEDRGVDVIYDGVGMDTLERGFDCVHPRGHVVVYGATSGEAPEVSTMTLLRKGSLFLTRVSMLDYCWDVSEYLRRAAEIFNWLESGSLRANIARRYSLAEAAKAHHDLVDRTTIGKILLNTQ
jgi:NADPH:quinone reductase-like Zn-dependent oxidoreductase